MLRVGLTGSIACGKSFVLSEFKKCGAATIDSDKIAHRLILPEGEAYRAIVDEFDSIILDESGRIDRKKLGALVFSDLQARERLNSIIHPFIFAEQERLLRELTQKTESPPSIAIVDAALMIETGSYRRYDCLVVVHCSPELQLQRLMERNQIGFDEAKRRIAAQMSSREKIKVADYVIDNSGEREKTQDQVKKIYRRLIEQGCDQNER